MFTGLVEEKGSVISLNSGDKSIKLKIKANKVLENVKGTISTNKRFSNIPKCCNTNICW